MNKPLLLAIIVFGIILAGCVPEKSALQELGEHGNAPEPSPAGQQPPVPSSAEETPPAQEPAAAINAGLGALCGDLRGCRAFCMGSRGRCEDYCHEHPDNGVCQQLGFAEVPSAKAEACAVRFDEPPVNLDKITHIEPMGSLHGEHVAPIDHQYYQNFNNAQPDIEVYAPGDGVIREIQHMGSFRGDFQREPFDDYRLVIEHTCTVSSVFIHIDRLSDKIMQVAPAFGKYKSVNVPVAAGELIGWFDTNVDFNVVDKAITISLIEPRSYASQPDRIHIQDPFVYFNEPVRQRLIAKSLRTAKPEGGFIDYDRDGTALGTWFREGTNGWGGLRQERYWADHLAIVYDSIDPEHVLFSVGTFVGSAQQFGVKGNAPDPATIRVETGMVAYELVGYQHYAGDRGWDFRSLAKGLKVKNSDEVRGVALLQLLEDRKMKVEVFPGKERSQVAGFTENAQVYVR